MKTALLWSTYGGDIEWFKFSARSYAKYASGFDHVKVLVPARDAHLFEKPCLDYGIHLGVFDEWPNKGFNHHQFMTCCADQHFPHDVEAIFHIDSDCVFASPCTPSDWLPGNKVLIAFSDFSRFLTTPVQPDEIAHFMGYSGLRSDFNRGCYFWKFAADFALGFPVERETMAWFPIVHRREVYSRTRELIEAHHHRPFEEYVKWCRNEFPQTFAEFNTLGGVAHKFYQDLYHWQDVALQGHAFVGKVVQSWSRGGFERPHEYAMEVGGYQTPIQLFQRLGLT